VGTVGLMTERLEPALLPWLRLTKAVEVHDRDGIWEVWVTNGLPEDGWEGARMASSPDKEHAELVAEGLRHLATYRRRDDDPVET
jgi:hypothetical protein